MTLDLFQARLEAEVAALKLVAGAVEFAAIQATPPAHLQPACYVIPLNERAGANNRVNAVRQRVVEEVGLVLIQGSHKDARGDTATAALQAVRDAARAALLGWEPDADHEMVVFAGGDLIDFRDGAVWWMDRYRSAHHIGFPV